MTKNQPSIPPNSQMIVCTTLTHKKSYNWSRHIGHTGMPNQRSEVRMKQKQHRLWVLSMTAILVLVPGHITIYWIGNDLTCNGVANFHIDKRIILTELNGAQRSLHAADYESMWNLRSRKALPITDTELNDIAAAAIIGLSRIPVSGYRIPAATGTPNAL